MTHWRETAKTLACFYAKNHGRLEHRDELLVFLKGQWGKLFGAEYDVLLYDLTSTYFECDPPTAGLGSKKRFGYSRDKRSDCVEVVVALVLTPEGFPVAYEVYPGNTRDTATFMWRAMTG